MLDVPLSAEIDPVAQGGPADPEILGDLAPGPTACLAKRTASS